MSFVIVSLDLLQWRIQDILAGVAIVGHRADVWAKLNQSCFMFSKPNHCWCLVAVACNNLRDGATCGLFDRRCQDGQVGGVGAD